MALKMIIAGQLTGQIEVELTAPQLKLAREVINHHEAMGDCELHGYAVRFQDYKGARAFSRSVSGLHVSTTRAYVSMDAILRKLDAAIVAAAHRTIAAAKGLISHIESTTYPTLEGQKGERS